MLHLLTKRSNDSLASPHLCKNIFKSLIEHPVASLSRFILSHPGIEKPVVRITLSVERGTIYRSMSALLIFNLSR